MRWPSTMGSRIAWADPDAGGGAPWIAVNATRNESTPRLTARPLHRARRPRARRTNVKHQFPSSTGALRAGIPDARHSVDCENALRRARESRSDNAILCSPVRRSRSMASCIALKRSCSSNGLVRNSIAPALIACTEAGILPWPVRNTMGVSNPASAIRFCRSSPLRPGSCRSNTTQLGGSIRAWARNSCAEAKVSAFHPTDRISRCRPLP